MEIRRIKIYVFLIALFLIPSFSHIYGATLTKPVNNLGLVGYWSFNEATGTRATDFSGRGNVGTLTNISAPATAFSGWGPGKFGNGLRLDGTDDYVQVANSSSIGITGDITISAWIKRNVFNDYGGIMSKSDGSSRWDFEFFMCGDSQCGGSNTLGFYTDSPGGNTFSSGQITDSNWHHVVVTRNTSTLTFYIDGVSAGTGTVSGAFNNNNDPIRIGTDGPAWNPIAEFNGSMDEVRLYNRGLSVSEVKKLYETGLVKIKNSVGATKINASQNVIGGSTLQNGLVGMWSFNSKDFSDKVYDRSSSANNGYVYNTATSTAKTIGKTGQGIKFDGTDDFVDLGANSSMNPTSNTATFSAWVYYTTNITTAMTILSKDTNAADSDFFFRIQNPSTGVFRCNFEGAGGSDTSAGVVTPGVWQHIACVWDGTNRIIYKNGVAVDTVAGTPTFSSSGGNVSLGRRNEAGGGLYFNGKIDEVRMYNRALTASEIKQLYLISK